MPSDSPLGLFQNQFWNLGFKTHTGFLQNNNIYGCCGLSMRHKVGVQITDTVELVPPENINLFRAVFVID